MNHGARNRPMIAGAVLAISALATSACAGGGAERAPRPWTAHMRALDEALQRGAVGAARNSWHMAYTAALAGHRWEDMLATGDAAVRIGDAAGTRRTWLPAARRAYLSALLYSRQQNSLDGVLRSAEAFEALGDREVVRQALAIARPLVAEGRDSSGRERMRAISQRSAIASSFAETTSWLAPSAGAAELLGAAHEMK